MFINDPINKIYAYAAASDDADDYEDEAAEEQSEEHDDRGPDPEPVQRD